MIAVFRDVCQAVLCICTAC